MEILLLISCGFIGVFVGRVLLKRWFNHLSIYSAMWTVSLVLYTFRLIQYNSIIPEAWFFIVLAWFVFYLGSITVLCARLVTRHISNCTTVTKKINCSQQRILSIDAKLLAKAITILSMIAALSIIHQWVTIIQYFGGFKAAIMNANLLYQLRVSGELQGGIPYLGSFALAACSLAGIYTAIRGKLSFVSILPLVLVGVEEIANMGRAAIVIAGVLFLTTFLYTPRPKLSKVRALIEVILVGAVAVGAFTFISSTRGLVVHFEHETSNMEMLRTHISFLPSIYFYLSGPPVVFSEYLKAGGENAFSGTHTLRPLFNVLSKFGLVDPLPTYSPPYFTPEPMNTGTYLQCVYGDFGPVGVVLFPYFLGFMLTMLHLQINQHPTLIWLVLLAHLFVVVFLSWSVYPLSLGYWWVSILVSLFISLMLNSLTPVNQKSLEGQKVCQVSEEAVYKL